MIKYLAIALFLTTACFAEKEFFLGEWVKIENASWIEFIFVMKTPDGWVMHTDRALTYVPDPEHKMATKWKIK